MRVRHIVIMAEDVVSGQPLDIGRFYSLHWKYRGQQASKSLQKFQATETDITKDGPYAI
jgi:hypothetical protein